MAPRVAGCIKSFKAVPITLETELAWPKHHAQYLEHIIQRCGRLHGHCGSGAALWDSRVQCHHALLPLACSPVCLSIARVISRFPYFEPICGLASRYDSLEPWTIFCKANLEKRRLNLREMVREIIDSKWAFYSFGNPKVRPRATCLRLLRVDLPAPSRKCFALFF